jgi:hypothetical protein
MSEATEKGEATFDAETFVRGVAERLGTGEAKLCQCGCWFVSYGEAVCSICKGESIEVHE